MINTNLPVPLHIQISNILEEKVRNGTFEDQIPSERALMQQYSVSRTTVREAVNKLVNEGILKKIHGKGTFINKKPPIQEWLSELNSFTETVKNMGMVPSSKLLSSGKLDKDEHTISIFKHSIYTIERLRYADGKPIAIERHFYPLNIGLQLAEYDLNKETIYNLLENELGITLMEADQFISTEMVNKQLSGHLEIRADSYIINVERTIFDPNGSPIEYYIGQYRPDMYGFRVKTRRNTNSNFSIERKM